MTSQSSLDDLLVSEENMTEGLLTDVLSPYVQIGDRSGAFVPTEEFHELNALQQTAVVLLFRKAAHELDLADSEGAGPSEIAQEAGLNHSTVRDKVRELDDRSLVVNEDGVYTVPAYCYDQVREVIAGE